MVACVFKCPTTLRIFLKYGGTDMTLKDKDSKDLYKICDRYGSHECKKILKENEHRIVNGMIPLNLELLE